MKNKTVVYLLGQEYNIVSEASAEHMQRVCFYVDGKFKEVASRNSFLNNSMTAVLSAINIAEDFLIVNDENLELSKKNKIANEQIEKMNIKIKELEDEIRMLKFIEARNK